MALPWPFFSSFRPSHRRRQSRLRRSDPRLATRLQVKSKINDVRTAHDHVWENNATVSKVSKRGDCHRASHLGFESRRRSLKVRSKTITQASLLAFELT